MGCQRAISITRRLRFAEDGTSKSFLRPYSPIFYLSSQVREKKKKPRKCSGLRENVLVTERDGGAEVSPVVLVENPGTSRVSSRNLELLLKEQIASTSTKMNYFECSPDLILGQVWSQLTRKFRFNCPGLARPRRK